MEVVDLNDSDRLDLMLGLPCVLPVLVDLCRGHHSTPIYHGVLVRSIYADRDDVWWFEKDLPRGKTEVVGE